MRKNTKWNATATAKLKKAFDRWDFAGIARGFPAGADPNVKNQNGETLLSSACWYGEAEAVERVLQAGANPNLAKGKALLSTVRSPQGDPEECLRLLLQHGVDVATRFESEAGGNALMIAIQNSKREMAEMLIDAGTDLTHEDDDGYTALRWAKEMGFKSLMTKLAGKQGKKLRARDTPETDPKIDTVYAGRFAARAGAHVSGIPDTRSVYTAARFPGCGNPPVHLLTVDLSAFPELPEKLRRIGRMPVVFHNCDCDEQDFYALAIQRDGRLKPLDPLGRARCAPGDFRNSKKAVGVTFGKAPSGRSESIVVGGDPRWAQARNDWASCPKCGKRSFFVVFIYQFDVPPSARGRGNHLNVFVCPDCKTQSIVRQCT